MKSITTDDFRKTRSNSVIKRCRLIFVGNENAADFEDDIRM